jgi:hypothetical protein
MFVSYLNGKGDVNSNEGRKFCTVKNANKQQWEKSQKRFGDI